MNPTRIAIRKNTYPQHVNTPALPCLLARLPTISTAPRRIFSSTNIVDSMAIGFVFSYFDKKLPVLALLVDITSETIRYGIAPTGTIDMAFAASSAPPLTPDAIPGDRVPLNSPYDSCTISPPTIVISAAVVSSAISLPYPMPVYPPACPTERRPYFHNGYPVIKMSRLTCFHRRHHHG